MKEDKGIYWRGKGLNDDCVMSLETGNIYRIPESREYCKLIGHASQALLDHAKADVKNDGPCWYGEACMYDGTHGLAWDY